MSVALSVGGAKSTRLVVSAVMPYMQTTDDVYIGSLLQRVVSSHWRYWF